MCASSLLRSCDSNRKPGSFPVAYQEYHRIEWLSFHLRTTDDDLDSVNEAVHRVVKIFLSYPALDEGQERRR